MWHNFQRSVLFVFPLGFGWTGWDGKDGNYYTHYELCLSFRYVLSIAREKKVSVGELRIEIVREVQGGN